MGLSKYTRKTYEIFLEQRTPCSCINPPSLELGMPFAANVRGQLGEIELT